MSYVNKRGSAEKRCRVCAARLCANNWQPANKRSRKYVCRSCHDVQQRRRTKVGRLSHALSQARTRGRKLGLPGAVSLRELLPLPTVCPLLGIPLHYGPEKSNEKATFDRIDPTRGYESGNVWIVSHKANRLKGEASLAELKTLVANLRLVKPE